LHAEGAHAGFKKSGLFHLIGSDRAQRRSPVRIGRCIRSFMNNPGESITKKAC